jgi:oligosaccharide repeat unit polymerase
MGNAEAILSVEGVFAVLNLLIAVILLCTYFFSVNHTLAFVHVAALWLILIYVQFAKLSAGTLQEGLYLYGHYDLVHIVVANLAIGIWLVAFAGSYLLSYRLMKIEQRRIATISAKTLGIAFVLSCAALAYLYFRLGDIVATRAAFDEAFAAETTMEGHLVEFPLRAFPFYAIGACIIAFGTIAAGWRRRVVVLASAVLGIAALIINNPLAASRFFLGVIAIGLLYLVVLRKAHTNLRLLGVIVIGVFGVLTLDFGRYALTVEDAIAQLEWSPEKLFVTDIFSTFESVPAAVRFIDAHGTTSGWQLIGNLLFFLPRSVWSDKPIGSGAFMVQTEFGYSTFSNVSCAAPCEGLINFGLPGVILLAVMFGLILAFLDKKQSRIRSLGNAASAFTVYYAFFIGHVFLITRGDLLSPLAIVVSMSLSYVVLWMVTKTKSAHAVVTIDGYRFRSMLGKLRAV